MNLVFAVGELAVIKDPTGFHEFNNDVVLVTQELHERTCRHRFHKDKIRKAHFYGVRLSDGTEVFVEPNRLRKLRDDPQKISPDRPRICIDYKGGRSEIFDAVYDKSIRNYF